nr:MAG: hypothetical protein 1 [Leviviridae sp.]
MVQVQRSRSRLDLDTFETMKYGSASAINLGGFGTFVVSGGSSNVGWATSPSGLPDKTVIRGVSIPFGGVALVTSVYAGTTWYRYNTTELKARVQSYATAICQACEAEAKADAESRFSSSLVVRRAYSYLSMTDVVTSRFKERSSHGEVIMSPMSSSKEATSSGAVESWTTPFVLTFTCSQASANTTSPWSQGVGQTILTCTLNRSACTKYAFGVPEAVRLAFQSAHMTTPDHIDGQPAINQAFSAITQAELDLPLILAESGKTIAHIALTVSRLAKLVKGLKLGAAQLVMGKLPNVSWKSIPTSSKEFSSLWLEARYAWRPLLMDIESSIKYLSKNSTVTPRRTFRGFTDDDDVQSVDWTYTSGGYSYKFVGDITTSRVARAGVLTEIDFGLERLRDLGGLNLFGTGWELIPFSFVVDWFVDVKGIIASLNPQAGIKTLGSWCTYFLEKQFSGTVLITHTSSGQNKTANFSSVVQKKLREPGVSTNFINLDVNLDIYKLVDAAALLRMLKR